jgi:hypothetical protein
MGNGVGYSPVVMLPPSLVLPPLISTCMNSAVGFMHDVRVCSGCMRVNGVNGVCCAVERVSLLASGGECVVA